jgi:hypothetical protein
MHRCDGIEVVVEAMVSYWVEPMEKTTLNRGIKY